MIHAYASLWKPTQIQYWCSNVLIHAESSLFITESLLIQCSYHADTCLNILNVAETEKIPAQEAAIKMAENRIDAMGKVKLSF